MRDFTRREESGVKSSSSAAVFDHTTGDQMPVPGWANTLPCHAVATQFLTQIDRSYIWQKGDCSRPFDCMGERSLVFGATTGQSPGYDFTAFGDEIS
jgi:hypothetical protein